jgi:hypothetical protein
VTSIFLPVIQEMIVPIGNIATLIGLIPVTSTLLLVNQEMIALIVPVSIIRNIAPIRMASALHPDTNSVIL